MQKFIQLQKNNTKFIIQSLFSYKNCTNNYQPYKEIPYKVNGVLKNVQKIFSCTIIVQNLSN